MTSQKTAPDPQIGSNPELLALCQEHIDECARLRDRLREREETVSRQNAALQSIERQLIDISLAPWESDIDMIAAHVGRLALEAHNAYTD